MPKNTLTILFFLIMAFLLPKSAQAATATGTIVSAIHDPGLGVNWGEMSWTASTTASSTITMKVRTATTSDMSSAPDWSGCDNVSSGADISGNNCVTDGERYIQYQAYLSSEYATATEFVSPELDDLTIKYGAVGALISSPYNALADDAVLTGADWSEIKPAGTDVLVQLRTSADGSDWSSWMGPDGTSDDYFTDPAGGESIPAAMSDGADDQYLQYKIILDSGGLDLPVISDITINYHSKVPVITGVSPSYAGSNASGTIAVTISGSDFKSGSTVKLISWVGVEISGTEVSAGADEISCQFDLSSAFGGPADIVVTTPNTEADSWTDTWTDFYINEYRGTYVSRAMDLPNLYFNAFSWTATTSATSSVSFKIRTDTKSDMSGALSWDACNTVASGTDISGNNCVTDGDRYVQYRMSMTAVYGTSTDWITPELGEARLGYAHYAPAGELTSSPYDTGSAGNALSSITWTESVPAGTDVLFQIRTAPDAGGTPGAWSEWFGPYEADDYYRNPGGQGGIYLGQTDGAGDQWLQYRARLESDGLDTPALSDITIEYGDKQYSETIINDDVILKDGTIFR